MPRTVSSPIPGQSRRLDLLKYNLAVSALIFLLLEIWRPCYFLTDDNLAVGFPFLTELGRHLKNGQSPFYSDYIYGGHYNLLRDCMYFTWHPLYFLVSLFADSPLRFEMLDLIALALILLTTAGFVFLAFLLREELNLKLSDARLMFYTLSFVYSTFILTSTASWVNILANQSALPWLAFGLLQKSGRYALGLILVFSIHQILGGQFSATLSNDIFLSLFAVGIAFYRKSWMPLTAWVAGHALALAILSPLLVPAIDGFFHSQRGGGLDLDRLTRFGVPTLTFIFSFIAGNYAELYVYLAHDPAHLHLTFPRIPTLLACAAAWCIFPALSSQGRWSYLEKLCLGLVILLAILIIRPIWISKGMLHVPVLRSMRWPFREILQFQFFIHLLLVLRPQSQSVQMQNRVALFSLVFFLLPLPFIGALTMNPLKADRQFLFSGDGDRFWTQVKTQLKPGDQIVSVLEAHFWNTNWKRIPYSMIGAGDFPAYFQVHSITGYSMTAPLDQVPLKPEPVLWFGTFAPYQLKEMYSEHPHLKVIWLESLQPPKITLYSDDAPPVDLTPYLRK